MKDRAKNRSDKEDHRWVQRTKKGNRKAFEKLVVKYQKSIYYAVRKMVMDHEQTNDIVQDTFVKAFSNLHRFDEQYAFYPWLHRIAMNTTLNHLARTSRAKKTFDYVSDDEKSSVISDRENPLEAVILTETRGKVTEALQSLPPEQRMIFLLRTSEELSYQEISEQLDISIGTVMSRLSRARAKLKELLGEYLAENIAKV